MNGKEKRNISDIKKYSKRSSHLFHPSISTDGKRKKKHSFLFSQVYLVENRFRESVL